MPSPSFKYNRDFPALLSSMRKPDVPPETGWGLIGASQPWLIPFGTGIDNVGASLGYAPTSHYLSADGETRSRGVVGEANAGDVLYTLPEEHKPEYKEVFLVAVLEATMWGVGFVEVNTNGDVTLLAKHTLVSDFPGSVSGVDGGTP